MIQAKQTGKNLRISRIALVGLLLSLMLMGSFGKAQAASGKIEVLDTFGENVSQETATVIYFFWGEGCPHCAQAKPVFEAIAENDPNIELRSFEVYYDPLGTEFFFSLMQEIGMEPRYVPSTIIGEQVFEGFSEQVLDEILNKLAECRVNGCQDRGAELYAQLLISGIATEAALPTEATPQTATSTPIPSSTPLPQATATEEAPQSFDVPLIGEVDLSRQSLFLSTMLIAFVDGFNPCSIWVLTMLLSITLHSGSRRKILIIGLVFISTTALIYALFIGGLFTVFKVISFVGWIRVVVALVAVFFGLINIKDYFWYKEGLSFTIDDKSKPGLYKRMRDVANAGESIWGLIGATVVLAAGVSLVEFSCTAGFPVLWTNLLTSQGVSAATFIALLFVYMLVYQLDELGIFFAAVFTFKSSKVEEKHGRILKLIGGMLMLTLAGVMLFNPARMNNLKDSLIIFGIALGTTLSILLLHRVILPRFGIYIGTRESKG